jgi:hypothetical protein
MRDLLPAAPLIKLARALVTTFAGSRGAHWGVLERGRPRLGQKNAIVLLKVPGT